MWQQHARPSVSKRPGQQGVPEPDWKRARGGAVSAPKMRATPQTGGIARPPPTPPPKPPPKAAARVIKVTGGRAAPVDVGFDFEEEDDDLVAAVEEEEDDDLVAADDDEFPWETVDDEDAGAEETVAVDQEEEEVADDGYEDESLATPTPPPPQPQLKTRYPSHAPHLQQVAPKAVQWQQGCKGGRPPMTPMPAPSSSAPSSSLAWQGRPAAKAGVRKPARLPEDLGFDVSRGVARKGWEIGQMEDGIRESEDGEPDVFLSHSYSDNCRRVDMAVFECDCPNSLTCCSHAYAALVALPHYRHRCALLWAMRNHLDKHWMNQGGFEFIRMNLKQEMMRRLPLDDLVDAAIDASLGLWTRVDWLRKNRAPKMERYWADRVKQALGGDKASNKADAEDAEIELGGKVQNKVKAFLAKLSMGERDLAPLFLALGMGTCAASSSAKGSVGKAMGKGKKTPDDPKWARLAQSMWAHVASDLGPQTPKASEKTVTVEQVKSAVTTAVAEAESTVADWEVLQPIERLWRVEQLVLKKFDVSSFVDLRVSKTGGKANGITSGKGAPNTGSAEIYHSFLELLSTWPECPEALLAGTGAKAADSGTVEIVDREATTLLEELGGKSAFITDAGSSAAAEELLASLLNKHFGLLGEASDWSDVAARALASQQTNENIWRQSAVVTASAAVWEEEPPPSAGGPNGGFAALATEGWEAAASRLIGHAPPMIDLRAWLLWEQVFEPHLGSLRVCLRRLAASIGVAVFEVQGGHFIKIDAATGTTEAWQAALAASDSVRAAEALLAFCHGCGGVRTSPLEETLGPYYKAKAQSVDAESFAALAGTILAELPAPFAQNASIVKFLLAPIEAQPGSLRALGAAAGQHTVEQASLLCASSSKRSFAAAGAFATQAAQRLETGQSAGVDGDAGARKRVQTFHSQLPSLSVTTVAPAKAEAGSVAQASVSENSPSATAEVAKGTSAVVDIKSISAPSAPSVLVCAARVLPSDPAEALVAQIRLQEFGFDGESPTGGDLQARQNARLARALKRLAGELYGSDVHWQLELLQNADDNSYEIGLAPTAEFVLRDCEVIFRCNETGFREGDIRAICDIGNSSKVGTAKYAAGGRVMATGEKGLGFKAVFALTNTPRIFSGPYRLEFDALHPSGIGYVLPRWLEDDHALLESERLLDDGWGSALQMALRPDLRPRQAELFERLAELPPSSLLFLKKLREVAVVDSTDNASGNGIRMRRTDGDAHGDADTRWQEQTIRACVEVSRGKSDTWDEEKWLLLRRRFDVPEGISKPGITPPRTTLVEVALPLDSEGALDLSRGVQPVFAFLPVRSFGFNFALQADWAVSSSREELLTGCAWNEFLKARLPQLILELVEEVKKEPNDSPLKWSFYGVVPALASASQFFRSAVAQLHAVLRGHECMLTDENGFCLPRLAMRCTPEVRALIAPSTATENKMDVDEGECNGEEPAGKTSVSLEPLRAALRSQGLFFVHAQVETSVPAGLLDSLGVQRFGASHLLRLLPMAAEARPSLASWRSALALLDELLDAAPRADLTRLIQVAQKLPLLPLQGGEWSAADAGVFLPPAAEDSRGFPQALLSELRAIDPAILSESGGDDALLVARFRKLLRRLGVTALTPRQVFRDIVSPMFAKYSAPCKLEIAALDKPASTYLAFSGFIAAHAELADELKGLVGWPLDGLAEMMIGLRFSAPMLHSPRAASFLEALRGSPVSARLPAAPAGISTANALSEALEGLGLALPGCLVSATTSGDWQSAEFERLVAHCASERPAASGAARARLLAQSFDIAWQRFERYTTNAEGSESAFMQALRNTAWLPADNIAGCEEDDPLDSPQLCRASELCIGTAEMRAVFTETSLLAGRLTTAVSGKFAEALGVIARPSIAMAVEVLRGFGRRSPVGPETAVALYSYLQREGADLEPLKSFASIVTAAGEPAVAPGDVVWEDEGGACALSALLPLYNTRWRNFFVLSLGVPERPTAEQALRRVDQLSNSGGDVDLDAMWSVLLLIGQRLQSSKIGAAAPPSEEQDGSNMPVDDTNEWADIAKSLHTRRCLPLMGGGVGVPAEGIVYVDDCPRLPPRVMEDVKKTAALAAVPSPSLKGASHWSLLLRTVGLQPLSEACTISAKHGELTTSHELGSQITSLLPWAQRYLYHRHRAVHDRTCEGSSARIRRLRVSHTAGTLQLECSLRTRASDAPISTFLDVDAFLEDFPAADAGATPEDRRDPQLIAVPAAPLPVICVELARLLVPATTNEEEIESVKHAREGLSTFLMSASAGSADRVCESLGVGAAPPEEISWPKPDEVTAHEAAVTAAEAAKEAAALKAALASEGADDEEDLADLGEFAEEDGDSPKKKPRVSATVDGEIEVVPDIDGLGGGEAGTGSFNQVTEGSTGGHKDMGAEHQGDKPEGDEKGDGSAEGREGREGEKGSKGEGKKGEGKKGEGKKGEGKKGEKGEGKGKSDWDGSDADAFGPSYKEKLQKELEALDADELETRATALASPSDVATANSQEDRAEALRQLILEKELGGKDGKGKGKDKKGKGKKDRAAGEVGDIFSGLREKPKGDEATKDDKDEKDKGKPKFKTRVYDIEDMRKEAKKLDLPPTSDENNMSLEERHKVGRWGEEFVYNYLKRKMEGEEDGDKKKVVWVNETEETGFQYDVRVEDQQSGEVEAYVEVKATRTRDKKLFEMSYKEWNFAQKEGNRFVIFRVMNAGKSDVELVSIANPFRQWKDLNLGMCLSI